MSRISSPWLGLWHGAMGCCVRAGPGSRWSYRVSPRRRQSLPGRRKRRGSGRANFFFLHVYASVRGIAVHRGTSRLGFQFTGSGEHGISDLFCGKPLGREVPEKTVFGIVYTFFLRGLAAGGLTIGVTKHDRTVKIFEFPAPLDEGGGQPIKQLGVGRFFAQETEIVGASDQSLAEMLLPDAVYDHPRGEGVLREVIQLARANLRPVVPYGVGLISGLGKPSKARKAGEVSFLFLPGMKVRAG